MKDNMTLHLYALPENIYPIYYNNQILLLDTETNEYKVFSEKLSKIYLDLVNKNEKILEYEKYAFLFLEKKLLRKIDFHEKNILTRKVKKINSKGSRDHHWGVRFNDLNVNLTIKEFIEIYFYIHKIFYITKKYKIKGLINYISSFRKKNLDYFVPESSSIEELSAKINKVGFYYFSKLKCLEWTAVFVILSLKKHWKVNLVIGVQNYPFFAHAWPQFGNDTNEENKIIVDGLSEIISFPFE